MGSLSEEQNWLGQGCTLGGSGGDGAFGLGTLRGQDREVVEMVPVPTLGVLTPDGWKFAPFIRKYFWVLSFPFPRSQEYQLHGLPSLCSGWGVVAGSKPFCGWGNWFKLLPLSSPTFLLCPPLSSWSFEGLAAAQLLWLLPIWCILSYGFPTQADSSTCFHPLSPEDLVLEIFFFCCMACKILVSWPGIEPVPSALDVAS